MDGFIAKEPGESSVDGKLEELMEKRGAIKGRGILAKGRPRACTPGAGDGGLAQISRVVGYQGWGGFSTNGLNRILARTGLER